MLILITHIICDIPQKIIEGNAAHKRIPIHEAIYRIVNTGIQQHSWPFARHYTPTALKIETWKILVEKAISRARLLVTPHLINAWI